MANNHVELVVASDAKDLVARVNRFIDGGWELRGHIIPISVHNLQGMSGTGYCATLVRKAPSKAEESKPEEKSVTQIGPAGGVQVET